MLLFKLAPGVTPSVTKAALVSIFPASLIVAALAWWLAGLRGGNPAEVMNLRRPQHLAVRLAGAAHRLHGGDVCGDHGDRA